MTGTVAQLSENEAVVKLVYDTTRSNGIVKRDIILKHGSSEELTLGLRGIVVSKPAFHNAIFGKVRRGTETSREIFVVDPGNYEFELSRIVSDSPYVKVEHTSRERKRKWECHILRVQFRPGAETHLGKFESRIRVYTNHPENKLLEIPVTAKVTSEVEVWPDTLFLGMVKKGETRERSINVSTSLDKPLRIKAIENPFPDFISIKATPESGTKCILTSSVSKEAPVGFSQGEVILRTNNRDLPMVKVPLYVFVQERKE